LTLDWDRLTDQDFEELCFEFLSQSGFENIEWYGRGGNDRGRDIKCTKTEMILENITKVTHYLVQCKKWISRPPEPADLIDTIAWADVHKPNFLIIMVSNTLSGNTKDWLGAIQTDKKYSIFYYEEINLKGFLEKNKDIYRRYFEHKESKIDEYYIADIHQRLLLALAKEGNLSANGISEKASISIEKVKTNLEELVIDKIVLVKNKKYSLENSLASFLIIAEKLLETNYRFDFVKSQYANSYVNPELIKYIESRYYLNFTPNDRDIMLFLIRISPSGLQHALFGSNEAFKNGHEHLKALKLKESLAKKWADSFPHQLFLGILRKVISDLGTPDATSLLSRDNIEGYYLKIDLKMANGSKQLLTVAADSGVILQKAQGKIEAGQLLSVTDPDVFIMTGDILSNLDLFKQAIENYDLAISLVKDGEKLKAAYNNKGVTLRKMDKPTDAITCFDAALKIDPNLKEAIENKEECLKLLKG
jgi:tetratricopeptide (TPR) repeat protein